MQNDRHLSGQQTINGQDPIRALLGAPRHVSLSLDNGVGPDIPHSGGVDLFLKLTAVTHIPSSFRILFQDDHIYG